jgi:CRISPR/Cas system CMR subunit Cmr4 (Cas7 group RAMP superfamily)
MNDKMLTPKQSNSSTMVWYTCYLLLDDIGRDFENPTARPIRHESIRLDMVIHIQFVIPTNEGKSIRVGRTMLSLDV